MAADSPDDEEGGVYRLASDPPVGISTAAACEGRLDGDRKAAVKTYVKTLGPALRDRYGPREHYTPNQVRDTVVANGLAIDYTCWAYMLYCSPADFASIHSAAGEVCDYSAMRGAVADAFFAGNLDFITSDVTTAIVSGAAEVAAAGAGGVIGWLADVDWSGLLDWS